MQKQIWKYGILAGIFALFLAITSYHLRELPGDWYGDISIEHRAVLKILEGHWPWEFSLSAGPAYHYVVAAFAYLMGSSYETYKVASVATGLVGVLFIYLLGKELAGIRVGLLSALVASLSFWLILFARLGSSPQILSPLLSAGSVYFLVRYRRTCRWYDPVLSMLIAGWGLFTYPATFVLPLVVLVIIGWQLLLGNQRPAWWRALAISAGVLLPFVVWFGFVVKTNSAFGAGGYVGSKIQESDASPLALGLTFGKNMVKAVGMFQWTGDNAFRTNVSGEPMLDLVSGLMMDVGLIALVYEKRLRSQWGFVVAPMLILLTPSAAPGILPVEIPSASRSLGVAPFVIFLVALGLGAVWVWISRRFSLHPRSSSVPTGKRWTVIASLLVSVLVVMIGYLNLHKYFVVYAWGLPEHNQPWSLEIAQYIDTLPARVVVKMTACCWGDWALPEPENIYYSLKHPQNRKSLLDGQLTQKCEDLAAGSSYALIFPPNEQGSLLKQFRGCFPKAQGAMHYDGLGQPSFYSLLVDR